MEIPFLFLRMLIKVASKAQSDTGVWDKTGEEHYQRDQEFIENCVTFKIALLERCMKCIN